MAISGVVLAESLATMFPASATIFRCMAVFWIGTRMRSLGNMMHECSHGTFVGNAAANSWFGHLLAVLDFSSFSDYSRQHTSHHAYLGDPERDQDFRERFFLLNRKKKSSAFLVLVFFSITIIPLWILMLRPIFWAKRAPRWSNLMRVAILILITLGLLFSASRFLTLTYVLIPYLTTYQWMRLFSDACDHIFLTNRSEVLERSRNHLFKTEWINLLLFPRNDGFHLLHHLFPSMPTRFFPAAHSQLMIHPWYRNRSHFLMDGIGNSHGTSKSVELSHGQSK